jgi:hypothetical protein
MAADFLQRMTVALLPRVCSAQARSDGVAYRTSRVGNLALLRCCMAGRQSIWTVAIK